MPQFHLLYIRKFPINPGWIQVQVKHKVNNNTTGQLLETHFHIVYTQKNSVELRLEDLAPRSASFYKWKHTMARTKMIARKVERGQTHP